MPKITLKVLLDKHTFYLKLVLKKREKNQGKQAFLGILAWFWGSQYEEIKFLNITFYILRKQPCIQQALDLLL